MSTTTSALPPSRRWVRPKPKLAPCGAWSAGAPVRGAIAQPIAMIRGGQGKQSWRKSLQNEVGTHAIGDQSRCLYVVFLSVPRYSRPVFPSEST